MVHMTENAIFPSDCIYTTEVVVTYEPEEVMTLKAPVNLISSSILLSML